MGAVYIVIALVIVAVVVVLIMRSRGGTAATAQPIETLPAERPAQPTPSAKPKEAAPAPKPDVKPAPAPAAEVRVPSVRPPAAAETAAATPAATPAAAETPRAASVRPPAEEVQPAAAPLAEKKDLSALKKGLQQTRGGWVQRLVGLFGGKKEIDPELLEQIHEVLLTGDVGPKTTEKLTAALKERLTGRDVSDPAIVWSTLREVARDIIDVKAAPFGAAAKGTKPLVVLIVGVNGVGKTTTIGKLASRYKDAGKKVYLAAGDTFRAAAVAQLEAWGKRVGVPVVKGKDLSKPSAVVYEAVQTGAKETADVVIADTAGRLHTKTPLMDELRKLRDAAAKAHPGAPHEILLVLDATTGQNGIVQVKEFREALELTGIVLTKLDGTAKGGVILGICDEFRLPVRYVGVGEKVDDLREFDAGDFTDALFATPGDDETAAA